MAELRRRIRQAWGPTSWYWDTIGHHHHTPIVLWSAILCHCHSRLRLKIFFSKINLYFKNDFKKPELDESFWLQIPHNFNQNIKKERPCLSIVYNVKKFTYELLLLSSLFWQKVPIYGWVWVYGNNCSIKFRASYLDIVLKIFFEVQRESLMRVYCNKPLEKSHVYAQIVFYTFFILILKFFSFSWN